MSRVIKFRAWDNENNQMLDVQNLDFEDCFYGGETQIKTTMYSDYFDIREMLLMQYTGLHDKNGKEIYEGDIVTEGEYIGQVIWDEHYLGFFVNFIDTDQEPIYDVCSLEVIGNIYENKELLNT